MNSHPDASQATGQELPPELSELTRAVADLNPAVRRQLEPIVGRVVESTLRRKRVLGLVQEALSQLRLDMKYLMFDLEATRRERDALQQDLDDRSELS